MGDRHKNTKRSGTPPHTLQHSLWQDQERGETNGRRARARARALALQRGGWGGGALRLGWGDLKFEVEGSGQASGAERRGGALLWSGLLRRMRAKSQ